MATFDNLLSILRQWGTWKRIEEAPERIDAVEARLAKLEDRLARAPGEACPKCGALEFRTEKAVRNTGHFGVLGALDRHLKCGSCGHTEVHMESPGSGKRR
jgi:predicted nucleic-acid-binding Zn-ribbon protein